MISENTADVIFAYSMDRRLLYVNPAIEELTGYSQKELSRGPIDWFHPEDKAQALAAWETAFSGQKARTRFRLVTRDGRTKSCSSSWGPMLDEQGSQIGVQGRARDIADVVQAEQERLNLELRVQQSQRLESLGVLAGGIAHDFNNLLVGILGNAELALLDLPPSSGSRESIVAVTQASHRAANAMA